MQKVLFLSAFILLLTACSGGSSDSSSGSLNIDVLPSTPVPTTAPSDSSGPGGQGGGSCGLNGSYGICFNNSYGDSISQRTYTIVSGCNKVESRATFFEGANCTGNKQYEYTRVSSFIVSGNSASISGATEIDVTFESITQEFFPGYTFTANSSDYLFCDTDNLNDFLTTPKQTRTGVDCYSNNLSSVNTEEIVKRISSAIFGGNIDNCTGRNGACISGERPTSLSTNGLPVWN